jgi:hypothetical protein
MTAGRLVKTREPTSGTDGIFAEATAADSVGDGASEAVRGAGCDAARPGDGGILKFSPRAACSRRSVLLSVRKPGWVGTIPRGVGDRLAARSAVRTRIEPGILDAAVELRISTGRSAAVSEVNSGVISGEWGVG